MINIDLKDLRCFLEYGIKFLLSYFAFFLTMMFLSYVGTFRDSIFRKFKWDDWATLFLVSFLLYTLIKVI